MTLTLALGAASPVRAHEEHGKPAHKKEGKPAAKAAKCADCAKLKHHHAEKCCGKCKKHDDAHDAHGHAKH